MKKIAYPDPINTELFVEEEDNLPTKYGLPSEVKFCGRCVISNQRPSSDREFSHTKDTKKKNSKNPVLRFSDDNFGVVEQDIQIAEYIRKSFDTDNYPLALKAYFAKKLTERTRRLAVILKPLMLMCISFQTTTPEVLKLSKRYSASIKDAVFIPCSTI